MSRNSPKSGCFFCFFTIVRSSALPPTFDLGRSVTAEIERGACEHSLLHDVNFAVIVAMAAVRVMQVAVDEVVDVIAVRHRGMPATRAVYVTGFVARAGVSRRAGGRILGVDRQYVLFDLAAGDRVMQVAVVQVVDVIAVLDRGVSAVLAVLVIVMFVRFTGLRHGNSFTVSNRSNYRTRLRDLGGALPFATAGRRVAEAEGSLACSKALATSPAIC
jgi:hypothetical protein